MLATFTHNAFAFRKTAIFCKFLSIYKKGVFFFKVTNSAL
uniref:Uncharacterized protein n=1 Tax=Siphoviridae sp. ctVCm11 TaxID=2826358 RepID=A0A8S5QKR2_9CAUD|nr:MAG TPA: hypothetical protein [Siphoviridae sp. ctVCm11]